MLQPPPGPCSAGAADLATAAFIIEPRVMQGYTAGLTAAYIAAPLLYFYQCPSRSCFFQTGSSWLIKCHDFYPTCADCIVLRTETWSCPYEMNLSTLMLERPFHKFSLASSDEFQYRIGPIKLKCEVLTPLRVACSPLLWNYSIYEWTLWLAESLFSALWLWGEIGLDNPRHPHYLPPISRVI